MTTLEILKKPSTLNLKTNSVHPPLSPANAQTFEEVYKTSYSHGLEAIYALENVDIKSVRRIETHPQPIQKKPEIERKTFVSQQENLDLGEEFRGWIPSFVFKEPIHVLEISKHAEKILLENGIYKLKELKDAQVKNFAFLRGMGQGHIEEIRQKLNTYLEGQHLDRCIKVDFKSWLKSLVGALDRKKVCALLQSYDLAHHFSLTPSENVEIRKLTFEKKQEWKEELIQKMTMPEQKKNVFEDMQKVFKAFIKPWVLQRGGFASHDELMEKLLRASTDSTTCTNVLQLFKDVYFHQDFFSCFLHQIDPGIYCTDEYNACNYELIVDKACSYFYKTSVYYTLPELVSHLEREFSKAWIGFPDGYVEKVLRLSPTFRTRKGPLGLEIRANFHYAF